MEPNVNAVHRPPWNKGKIVGQKAPFKLKDIWALRVRLQMERRVAVDEYQARVRGLAGGNALHQLTVRLDRIGQALHSRRIADARGGEAQLQAVQIELHRQPPPNY